MTICASRNVTIRPFWPCVQLQILISRVVDHLCKSSAPRKWTFLRVLCTSGNLGLFFEYISISFLLLRFSLHYQERKNGSLEQPFPETSCGNGSNDATRGSTTMRVHSSIFTLVSTRTDNQNHVRKRLRTSMRFLPLFVSLLSIQNYFYWISVLVLRLE